MDGTQYTVTLKEFRQFHSIDRALYCLLTFDLLRDPTESLNVLALWLWLERLGFYNFVSRALSLPPFLVDQLADEAVECLNCLDPQSPFFPDAIMTEIPLTHSLAGRRDISLQFFVGRGNEVQTLVREVCTPLVADLKDAGPRTGPSDGPARGVESDRDERTVFVTFSKGYQVGEGELRGFLAGVLGGEDRVEMVRMQEVVGPGEQALYARVVLAGAGLVERVLEGGAAKVRLSINGKHVWVRRFVPRRRGGGACGGGSSTTAGA